MRKYLNDIVLLWDATFSDEHTWMMQNEMISRNNYNDRRPIFRYVYMNAPKLLKAKYLNIYGFWSVLF